MAHADSLIINITIAYIPKLAASILDFINSFQNTDVPIHEKVCVVPPPYYLDWFENFYPNVPQNRDDSPFFLQCMNGIQGTKPTGRKLNRLLDAVVIITKYKKNRIDHDIYIKFFTNVTLSYITVYIDDVLNTILLLMRQHSLNKQDFLKNTLR